MSKLGDQLRKLNIDPAAFTVGMAKMQQREGSILSLNGVPVPLDVDREAKILRFLEASYRALGRSFR